MRRSGALTLGAVLMLGGVSGGRGDELSGSVGAPSPGGFALPALPADWNWSELPVRLTASEAVSYNSNIFALPIGAFVPRGGPQGDFTSTSSYGLSTKANWYGQQFFFDGTFGGNCSPGGWLVQAGRGIGFAWRVRRMASMARIERRRAVSTTERMSA